MTPKQRAFHERQPTGRVFRLLDADAMTEEERRAEVQRRRVRDWHRRQSGKPAPDLRVLLEWLRP